VTPPFRLAHISDPHLFATRGIQAKELLNRRLFSYVKWRLFRGAGHQGDVLNALTKDLLATKPDHIVITGDLTHLGLRAEIESARRWLQTLGSPEHVTAIPGNHDTYIHSSESEIARSWSEYLRSDKDENTDSRAGSLQAIYPALRIRPPVAVIGIWSANDRNLLTATGTVGRRQLRKLESILVTTGRQGLFRVLLIHHPPLPGTVGWRKRLTDGRQFEAVVKRSGAELILHGHAHVCSQQTLSAASGNIAVNGISSASASAMKPHRKARYVVYRIAHQSAGWDITRSRRVYSDSHRRFVTEKNDGNHR